MGNMTQDFLWFGGLVGCDFGQPETACWKIPYVIMWLVLIKPDTQCHAQSYHKKCTMSLKLCACSSI